MPTYTPPELKAILELHKKWLDFEDDGVCADLRGTDLSDVDLSGANLRHVNLSCAKLIGANLRDANLSGSNLSEAKLMCANLRGADLSDARICDTDLRESNLCGADLHCAYLREADLRGADLHAANLNGVNLWSAVGNKKHVKSLQIEHYDITYTSDIIQIGCQRHKIEDWFEFDDETISKMDEGALEWWLKWKDYIKMTINMSPAEPTK